MRYLKNSQINYEKWDRCISKSLNGTIYAYSWYLDAVCDNWDAIIQGDYEIIMPLPYYSKYNYKIIKQPPFTYQLGIFSSKKFIKIELEKFINNIPRIYKEIELNLNKYNNFTNCTWNISKNKYYAIDLINSYSQLFDEYTFDLKNAIQKSLQDKFFIRTNLSVLEVTGFLRRNNYLSNEKDYNNLRRLIFVLKKKRLLLAFGAYNRQNTLIGVSLYIFSHYNTHLLLIVTSQDAEKEQVVSLLIDKFFQINSEKDITLNFDVALPEQTNEIIKNFGAKEYCSKTISIKRIPKVIKWFRK